MNLRQAFDLMKNAALPFGNAAFVFTATVTARCGRVARPDVTLFDDVQGQRLCAERCCKHDEVGALGHVCHVG